MNIVYFIFGAVIGILISVSILAYVNKYDVFRFMNWLDRQHQDDDSQ
jgi:cell division protein FtsW (lipid II flippase)